MGGLSFANLCKLFAGGRKKLSRWHAVIKVKKSSDEKSERNQAAEPLLIELSTTAKTNLKKLQLRSLDRQGRQPDTSQIIEKLINAAAVSGPDAPYPE
jgi:hypothetical protein